MPVSVSACLSVSDRITFKVVHHPYLYLVSQLKVRTPARNLRNQGHLLETSRLHSFRMMGDRAFSKAAPKLWNPLPFHIRNSSYNKVGIDSSIDYFKNLLKKHLFSQRFQSFL